MKKIILSIGSIASISASASVLACGKILPTPNPVLGKLNDYIIRQGGVAPSSDLVYWTENKRDNVLLVYRDGKYGKVSYNGMKGWHDFKYDISKSDIINKYKFYVKENLDYLDFENEKWRKIAPWIKLNIKKVSRIQRSSKYGYKVELENMYDFSKGASLRKYYENELAKVTKEPVIEEPNAKDLKEIKEPTGLSSWTKKITESEVIFNKEISELTKKITDKQVDWFKPGTVNLYPKLEFEELYLDKYPNLDKTTFKLDLSNLKFKDNLKTNKEFIMLAYAGYIMKKYKNIFVNKFFPNVDLEEYHFRASSPYAKILDLGIPYFDIVMPGGKTYSKHIFYAVNKRWALVEYNKNYYVL